MRTVEDKVHSHDSNYIYSVANLMGTLLSSLCQSLNKEQLALFQLRVQLSYKGAVGQKKNLLTPTSIYTASEIMNADLLKVRRLRLVECLKKNTEYTQNSIQREDVDVTQAGFGEDSRLGKLGQVYTWIASHP